MVARERRGLGGQISIQNSSASDGKFPAMRMARHEGQGRTSVWREGAGRRELATGPSCQLPVDFEFGVDASTEGFSGRGEKRKVPKFVDSNALRCDDF